MGEQSILLVDDEENMRKSLGALLRKEGYHVETASSSKEAIELATKSFFSLLVIDLKLGEASGIETYLRIKKGNPHILAIIITGHASVESAIGAIRAGAYDYLVKPFRPEEMLLTVKRALDYQKISEENIYLRRELKGKFRLDNIIGKSPQIEKVLQMAKKIAGSDVTVLLRGESGTGKELIARSIHYMSPRRERRFFAISCGAIPETLLESELFGHEKGAFTGAVTRKKGFFEAADGGTILLDEIGDLPLTTQMKLLRVLQEKEFQRVGSTETIAVDIRVISATNKDLEKEVREGRFREDLYYRVNVVSIALPPLRERKEDIPLLIEYFLGRCRADAKEMKISAEAKELLMNYHWPGNVRELENVIEGAAALSSGGIISAKDIALSIGQTPNEVFTLLDSKHLAGLTLKEAKEELEQNFMKEALKKAHGNVAQVARELGLSRRHLYERMKHYGVDPEAYK
jgi:DNA-binding NtrC family response regulator